MSAPRRSTALIVGDTGAFLAFSIVGRAEHKLALSLIDVIATALPFWLPWIVIGLWLRRFRPDAVAGPAIAVRQVVLPWILAFPWALTIRAFSTGQWFHPSFAVVSFSTVLLFLAGWRAMYAAWTRRSAPS